MQNKSYNFRKELQQLKLHKKSNEIKKDRDMGYEKNGGMRDMGLIPIRVGFYPDETCFIHLPG